MVAVILEHDRLCSIKAMADDALHFDGSSRKVYGSRALFTLYTNCSMDIRSVLKWRSRSSVWRCCVEKCFRPSITGTDEIYVTMMIVD